VELLLSGPGNRVKVAQYLLLDSEDALKQHLAQISAAYEQLQGDTAGGTASNAESILGVGRLRRRVGWVTISRNKPQPCAAGSPVGHYSLERAARAPLAN
jgi:hypothetical protein